MSINFRVKLIQGNILNPTLSHDHDHLMFIGSALLQLTQHVDKQNNRRNSNADNNIKLTATF